MEVLYRNDSTNQSLMLLVKPNTIIKRSASYNSTRQNKRHDEYLSVADSGDRDFLLAFKNFRQTNPAKQDGTSL